MDFSVNRVNFKTQSLKIFIHPDITVNFIPFDHRRRKKEFLKKNILKVYSVHYALRQNIISLGQNKSYKKCHLFFFREFQLTAFLVLVYDS